MTKDEKKEDMKIRSKEDKKTTKKKKTKWIFDNSRGCPRCGGHNTEAYRTHKGVQYRKCRGAICRWRYSVKGRKAV